MKNFLFLFLTAKFRLQLSLGLLRNQNHMSWRIFHRVRLNIEKKSFWHCVKIGEIVLFLWRSLDSNQRCSVNSFALPQPHNHAVRKIPKQPIREIRAMRNPSCHQSRDVRRPWTWDRSCCSCFKCHSWRRFVLLNHQTLSCHELDYFFFIDSCAFGSNKYFLLCGLGGIISCGSTHTMVRNYSPTQKTNLSRTLFH